MKRNIFYIISVLIICSCKNDSVNSNISTNTELKDSIVWKFDDTRMEHKKYRYVDQLLLDLNIYDQDCVLIQRQIYDEGERDSLFVYYPSGLVHELREYEVFQDRGPILNTYINYDTFGHINESGSCYYQLINEQTNHESSTSSKLKVKLIGGEIEKTEQSIRVITADFDQGYYYKNETVVFYYPFDGNDFIEIPIPRVQRNDQVFIFLIEEYKYLEDSTIMSRPIVAKYYY